MHSFELGVGQAVAIRRTSGDLKDPSQFRYSKAARSEGHSGLKTLRPLQANKKERTCIHNCRYARKPALIVVLRAIVTEHGIRKVAFHDFGAPLLPSFQKTIQRQWSRLLLKIGRVRAEAEGVGKLDPARPYVLAANHCSYMDTPLVLGSIPLDFRFFAKQGLFLIPLLGTHLKRAGHIPVIRDNPRAAIKTLSEGARLIRERNISVLLFPEGGRSERGLLEFKEGAAYVAIKAGVPIVPLGIVGTREVLPMHSWNVRPGRARLVVGDPIETAGMALQDRAALTRTVRDKIAELIGEPVAVP